jgi:hypothetical protein
MGEGSRGPAGVPTAFPLGLRFGANAESHQLVDRTNCRQDRAGHLHYLGTQYTTPTSARDRGHCRRYCRVCRAASIVHPEACCTMRLLLFAESRSAKQIVPPWLLAT